jgi:hypothetical protein
LSMADVLCRARAMQRTIEEESMASRRSEGGRETERERGEARATTGSLLLEQPWWWRSARAPSRAGRGQGASERARASESDALPLPKM